MKHKFPQVVACITLILVVASVVLTFVGAFINTDLGDGLMWTGIFGFIAISILGWIMIRVYTRVHQDEDVTDELLQNSEKAESIEDKNEE